MSKDTKIEWCDSTVNPTMGCDGCELWNANVKICYAGQLTSRYGGHSSGYPARFEDVTQFPGRTALASKWSDLRGTKRDDKPWIPKDYPRLVFISDMSDAMSRAIPFEYLKTEIIDVVAKWPHIGLWLTKQPKRMAEFSTWLANQGVDWPNNLWPGTSVTSPDKIHRIVSLASVGNSWTKRFVSFEPLLGELDFTPLSKLLWETVHTEDGKDCEPTNLFDWAILGGKSGGGDDTTDLDGMLYLMNMLTDAGVKVFVKQLGTRPFTANSNLHDFYSDQLIPHGSFAASALVNLKDKKGGNWNEWTQSFRRREFPNLD